MEFNARQDEKIHRLIEVARLHYIERLTRSEVSHRIKATPNEVKRLLDEAREKGFVRIEIFPPLLEDTRQKLLSRFDFLKAVYVVPSSEDPIFERKLCAEAAAYYFDRRVDEKVKTFALGGGNSLYDMVSALPQRRREISIYPTALIGRGPMVESPDRSVIMSILWSKSGDNCAAAYYASILAAEDSLTCVEDLQHEHEQFLKRSIVRQVYDGMLGVESVFTGLGPADAPQAYTQHSHHTTLSRLTNLGLTPQKSDSTSIAGEVSYDFFDDEGNTKPEWKLGISIGVEELKKMVGERKEVVVVAGRYKERALKAALNGRMFNVLITDNRTATELLKAQQIPEPPPLNP